MATNQTVGNDNLKYLFKMGKVADGGTFYSNPIAEYMGENSQREPDVLRRLREVHVYIIHILVHIG